MIGSSRRFQTRCRELTPADIHSGMGRIFSITYTLAYKIHTLNDYEMQLS